MPFAKGPWRIGEAPVSGTPCIFDSNEVWVCGYLDNDGHPDNKANAHLIAAAPDMYEALELIFKALGSAEWGTPEHGAQMFSQVIDANYGTIQAALAKARGEAS